MVCRHSFLYNVYHLWLIYTKFLNQPNNDLSDTNETVSQLNSKLTNIKNGTTPVEKVLTQNQSGLYQNNEGGNLRIISPNGNHTELDMHDDNHVSFYSGTPTTEVEGAISWSKNLFLNLDNLVTQSKGDNVTFINGKELAFGFNDTSKCWDIQIVFPNNTRASLAWNGINIWFNYFDGKTWRKEWIK